MIPFEPEFHITGTKIWNHFCNK